MNRRPRVLLVGRHFWPHGSIDSAGYLFHLACALHRHGLHVEVVTPRYASSWSEEFLIRGVRVHRPTAAPRSDWSIGRYVRYMTNWMQQNAGSFDLIMADAIREESIAAIEASRSNGRVSILRCGGWGAHSDTAWWQTSRAARRCGSMGKMADAVIAKSAVCQRTLLAEGYAASRIVRIDNGFASGPLRTAESRRAARKALGAVNSDLASDDDSPVVLCVSRMTSESGMNLLVRAARHLVARYPDLRLWLIGDGPHRDRMYEYLRSDGVRASIAMPGSFCDMEELFAAADVFVQTDDDGLERFLPAAIAAELPIVTIDTESIRAVITGAPSERDGRVNKDDETGGVDDPSGMVQWCGGATEKYIRMGLVAVLDDLETHGTRASQLRRALLRSRPQSETITAYVELMERLIREKPSSHSNSSIEAVS